MVHPMDAPVKPWYPNRMGTIHKAKAMRTALHLASNALYGMHYVRLDPDGTLWGTDGYALVQSKDAHDLDLSRTLYIVPPNTYRAGGGEVEFRIDRDKGEMVEVRARSERTHETTMVEDINTMPPLVRALPSPLEDWPEGGIFFDSIRAGKVAEVYGLSHGVWLPAPQNRVILDGLDEGDFITLAGMRK